MGTTKKNPNCFLYAEIEQVQGNPKKEFWGGHTGSVPDLKLFYEILKRNVERDVRVMRVWIEIELYNTGT